MRTSRMRFIIRITKEYDPDCGAMYSVLSSHPVLRVEYSVRHPTYEVRSTYAANATLWRDVICGAHTAQAIFSCPVKLRTTELQVPLSRGDFYYLLLITRVHNGGCLPAFEMKNTGRRNRTASCGDLTFLFRSRVIPACGLNISSVAQP
jgi:hypothetical protein